MRHQAWLGGLALLLATAGEAAAETAGVRLRAHLEAGRAGVAAKELAGAWLAGAEQKQAQGFAEFVLAVERLLQGLHRHGLVTPSNPFLPVLRLPLPPNPAPEPLDYAKLRAVYQSFLDDLKQARATLAQVGPHAGRLVLDIDAIKLTVAAAGGGRHVTIRQLGEATRNPFVRPAVGQGEQRWEVAFDHADALWLQGYTHLIAALFELVLAHDWRETYEATGHLFFAGAAKPKDLADPARGGLADQALGGQATGLADQIAFLHLMRWPAGDRARMLRAREHLKAVVALSRETWKAIRAETDDDREWLPSPRQTNRAVPTMPVTEEMVQSWHATLDNLDALLDGRKLVPHWRFNQGINLRKVFEEPKPFDLVLWITGHGAVPFLDSGPMLSYEEWWRLTRPFNGNFLGYAVYFN